MRGRVVLYRAAFSPDGKLLATVSEDNTVRLWDVATRQPVGPSITGHEVLSVAFSPGGKLLAIGGSDLDLWDVASRQPVRQPLRGDTHSAFSVAFSPDGTLLAGAEDGTVQLWDVASRQPGRRSCRGAG